MPRPIISIVLLTAGMLLPVLQAGAADEASDAIAAASERLSVFQPFIGSWKGAGIQKLGGNDRWVAELEWFWSFEEGTAAVAFSSPQGRYFRGGRLTAGDDPHSFRLTAQPATGTETETYRGTIEDDGQLVLVNESPRQDRPSRLLMRTVAEQKRFVIIIQSGTRPGSYQQAATLGYTRKGVVFATRQQPLHACVVTGGEANQAVHYQGETYWVCCKGCLSMFEANPAKVIAAHEARQARRGLPSQAGQPQAGATE